MDRDLILKSTIRVLSMISDEDDIREECELIDDLGISSMDILTVLASLEEEFHVKVPDRYVRKMFTVGDLADIILSLKK